MKHDHITTTLLTIVSLAWIPMCTPHALAQNEGVTSVAPTIEITEEDEDGDHLLLATVSLDGEPVEGAMVTFSVVRTFGSILLGSEETFDDGTAAVDFPTGIPGDASGNFIVMAMVEGDGQTPAASETATFKTDAPPVSVSELIPPSLWSARPLWPLIAVIAFLLSCVWFTYGFVIVQLLKLRS